MTATHVDSLPSLRMCVLREIPSAQEATRVLAEIKTMEKKTFPTHEVFDFSKENVYKQNTQVFCVYQETSGVQKVVAYAVCVRSRKVLLLHKICVGEHFRLRGIGNMLLSHIKGKAAAEKCRQIELWVDESRVAARHLYERSGFQANGELVKDYYAPGRNALNMIYIFVD